MSKYKFKGLVPFCLAVILLWSCSNESAPIIVSSTGWPGGWLSDGSELLIYTFNDVFLIAIDDSSFSRKADPWDFSQAIGGCANWSPNGDAILYRKRTNDGEQSGIYHLGSSGKARQLIALSSVSCPVWSPDGQQFAIYQESRLHLFDAAGHNHRVVPVDASLTTTFSWSPDGKKIAFSDFEHINIVDIETGQLVGTGGFPRPGLQPTWSPDGQYIAYIEGWFSAQRGNLIIEKLDGTQRMVLAGIQDLSSPQPDPNGYFYSDPMWSPSGNFIAVRRIRASYLHNFDNDNLYEVVLIPVPNLQ